MSDRNEVMNVEPPSLVEQLRDLFLKVINCDEPGYPSSSIDAAIAVLRDAGFALNESTAADRIVELEAENAVLRAEIDTWRSVFPDIAPEQVLPDRSKLEAENARLRALLGQEGEALAELTGSFEKAGEPSRMQRWRDIPEGRAAVIIDKQLRALTAIKGGEDG